MSLFFNGRYVIPCRDTSYINAITTYNQKSWIESIQYGSGKSERVKANLSQLPSLIKKAQALGVDTITVDYRTANASSLYKVFPEMMATESQRKLASQQCSFASHHLDAEIQSATDCGEVGWGWTGHRPESITREEALFLVLGSADVSGAIELPELNTIIFQTAGDNKKSACFYITYGNECSISSMHMIFDIDDGFICTPEPGSQLEKVVQTLQAYFSSWKDRKYKGDLIPKEAALNFTRDGLTLMPSAMEPLSRFGGRGFFFSGELSRDHKTYYNSVTTAINDSDNYNKTIELLKDYTKSNSFFGAFLGRVLHGAWNRNHLNEVEKIINNPNCKTVIDVLTELDKIPLENKFGALARRIEFIRSSFVEKLDVEQLGSFDNTLTIV